ncbi:MAG: oxygen-independent coproporphyrinogen III oxidase [Microscillaceae bacterium]|nr:oxygen-independent coproporphyrinogen III oxidase [Microscillaceae bacterium]MDW8460901.1 oxygen-independent coproporphyrinogen III oxidase [Cytophagales bacterium]
MKNKNLTALLEKYDVPTPRYTSYPTVPFWNEATFDPQAWKANVQKHAHELAHEGISLYIHLPFCEQLCTYCGCNKRITKNHQVELPYLKSVLHEWHTYLAILPSKPWVKEIHLGGGTPTFFSPENLHFLLANLLPTIQLASDAELSVEVHPNVTTYEHLAILRKLGFHRLSVGIQDFDPAVQYIINRIQSFEKTKQIFEWARALGYVSINADLVFGLPLQTSESIRFTIEKIQLLRPERIAFYSYAHVPWKSASQRRYNENDLPKAAEKRALYELGRDLLLQQGYHELGLDHFALAHDRLFQAAQAGKMHRNFMGYTTQRTPLLIGLGASSISQTPDAFAQNEKTVETYQEQIAQKGEATCKGHFLSKEDKILQKHILNIMCQAYTDWKADLAEVPLLQKVHIRLRQFATHGLIELRDTSLQVTEAGKPFLRNIASVFDAYLFAKENSNLPLFSKTI